LTTAISEGQREHRLHPAESAPLFLLLH
jgi:hypothetical protein